MCTNPEWCQPQKCLHECLNKAHDQIDKECCSAGTVVAVKVRHPGVGQAIQCDFALMLRVARLLSLLPATAHLRLEDSLAQFAAPLREQVRLQTSRRMLTMKPARAAAVIRHSMVNRQHAHAAVPVGMQTCGVC